MDFPRTGKYDKDFLKKNMMGPNSMMILEELLEKVPLKPENQYMPGVTPALRVMLLSIL